MSGYMPQPDSGGNCCDCPSRSSPCDDCGGGACCTDGVCAILSADDCSTGGGNYLGDGSTCDGVDCTMGACCDSGDCSVTDEADCFADFQGDGTVCDPNPCPLFCCFPAFDGSGRMFSTVTVDLSGYSDSIHGGGTDCDSTESATGVHTCSGCQTCTGSAHQTGDSTCDEVTTTCNGLPFDPYSPGAIPRTATSVTGCTDSGRGCGGCCSFTLSIASSSATVRTYTLNPTASCSSLSGTLTATLSGECLVGGAFDDPFFQNN